MEIFNAFKELGIAGILIWVLSWVFRRMESQQKSWDCLQEKWMTSLDKHTNQAQSFHEEVKSSHANQQREHEAIMDIAGRILKCANKE